jgi:hypothetical protein
MDPQTLDTITKLVQKHAWIALVALFIGAVGRTMKTDRATKLPVIGPWIAKIPSNKRPYVIFVLGQASAVLDRITRGTRWQDAVLGGLVASALAAFGHDIFIEGVRGGQEVFGPDPKASTQKDRQPSDPPPSGVGKGASGAAFAFAGFVFARLLVFASFFALTGCGVGAKACAVIDVAETSCNVLPIRYMGPDGKPRVVLVKKDEITKFGEEMATRRAAEGASAPTCDGGYQGPT